MTLNQTQVETGIAFCIAGCQHLRQVKSQAIPQMASKFVTAHEEPHTAEQNSSSDVGSVMM